MLGSRKESWFHVFGIEYKSRIEDEFALQWARGLALTLLASWAAATCDTTKTTFPNLFHLRTPQRAVQDQITRAVTSSLLYFCRKSVYKKLNHIHSQDG